MRGLILFAAAFILAGCQPPPTANTAAINANSNSNFNSANSAAATNAPSNTAAPAAIAEAKEPEKYQAVVRLQLEALGGQQNAAIPTIAATVARNGEDRRMEFSLPNGEKVVYLDTVGSNYIILPNRRQFAELTRESLGFDVRRMLMPEQIVNQVRNVRGMERVGEETVNGRPVVKYRYSASAQTGTRAGDVGTESFLLIDAETGLPLRSETVSQSQSGGNVQGYKGLKIVTEMSDITMNPDPNMFTVPAEYARIDPEQVKAQAELVFNAAAAFLGRAMQPPPAER